MNTSSLHTLIPQIWAQTIERNLLRRAYMEFDSWFDNLPPGVRAKYGRKIHNRRHYYRKVAWAKAHVKRKKGRH